MGIVLEVQDPTTITRFDAIKVWRYDWIFKPLPDEPPARNRTSPDVAYLVLTERPTHFRAWLRGHTKGAVVGYASNTKTCPLKNWLVSTGVFGNRDVRVMGHSVLVQRFRLLPDWVFLGIFTHRFHRTTRWMEMFVQGVDQYQGHNAVTSGQALTVMGRCGS